MNMRKITSLTATLSFIVVVVTSIILYIVPQGRVAYWADWRLWGLSKEQWGEIHINVGLLFLLALILHIYYNWKPLMAYLKDKRRQMKIFTPAFNVALAICAVTVAGTLFMVPPFSWVLNLNGAFKDAGAEKYGEPPYGHAELSTIQSFAKKVELDPQTALQRLQAAGYQVTDGSETLLELATRNQTTPKALYAAMRPAGAPVPAEGKGMPDSPPPGTGRLSLADICSTYGLDLQALLAALKTKNISADASESLRDIAKRYGMGPVDLYEVVRSAAGNLATAG
ncbi:hypothetical protein DSCO28_46610 [Desulfosarcina ovata subsp. sediminis]|uniref:Flavinylation-associated cytochrome domain-containing protein n=1 Tax=Desulfosarcina ovata subsp. sediminis TaxID=885957 RepID=A0A5K7ZV17_9BACT|nr:DUF4405 domain-containing protein [Desulfosarcina ovata]BBO84095.1 hypothetical protein DSCO28_46610 [Desulfosarcina ovata subsp. sediminis]